MLKICTYHKCALKECSVKSFFFKLECSVFDPLIGIAASPYPIMYLKQVLKRETFLGRHLPMDNYWDWLDDHIKVKIRKIKMQMEIRDLHPQLFEKMIRYVNEKRF